MEQLRAMEEQPVMPGQEGMMPPEGMPAGMPPVAPQQPPPAPEMTGNERTDYATADQGAMNTLKQRAQTKSDEEQSEEKKKKKKAKT
jgi:hypothetical protein